MVNKETIPGFGNHNCVLKLYSFDEEKIKELFQLIIKLNGWCRNAEISAASANEDNAVIIYRDEELHYFDPLEERESNMPLDDMNIDDPWDSADHELLKIDSESDSAESDYISEDNV